MICAFAKQSHILRLLLLWPKPPCTESCAMWMAYGVCMYIYIYLPSYQEPKLDYFASQMLDDDYYYYYYAAGQRTHTSWRHASCHTKDSLREGLTEE